MGGRSQNGPAWWPGQESTSGDGHGETKSQSGAGQRMRCPTSLAARRGSLVYAEQVGGRETTRGRRAGPTASLEAAAS